MQLGRAAPAASTAAVYLHWRNAASSRRHARIAPNDNGTPQQRRAAAIAFAVAVAANRQSANIVIVRRIRVHYEQLDPVDDFD